MGEASNPLAWNSETPKVAGDYLYAYRFAPDDDWTSGRMTLGVGGYKGADTHETLWFGPIPPLPGQAAGDAFKEFVSDVKPSSEGGG